MRPLVLAGAALLTTFGACGQAHADTEPDAEVLAAAQEAGVSALELLGAMTTTHLEPRAYLYAVGELVPPPPPIGVWDRLAVCESHGNWATNTGNGYWGGLQFDLQTWHAYGGVGLPSQASRATQIAVAERVRAVRGYQPWPVCSRLVGLR